LTLPPPESASITEGVESSSKDAGGNVSCDDGAGCQQELVDGIAKDSGVGIGFAFNGRCTTFNTVAASILISDVDLCRR